MKLKVRIVTGVHTSKDGVDAYTRIVKKNEKVENVIESMKAACDYDPNGYNEYFDVYEQDLVLDTDDFEMWV